MERVILVDRDDKRIGVLGKLRAHREGVLHRAFSVFILNSKGDLLVQKRSEIKYHTGGLWTNTCDGHPRPGETTAAAAHRRLAEEMGFDCALDEAFAFVFQLIPLIRVLVFNALSSALNSPLARKEVNCGTLVHTAINETFIEPLDSSVHSRSERHA